MFGHSMFMQDPFFRAQSAHMQQMNQMFGRQQTLPSQDPFLALAGPGASANRPAEMHRQLHHPAQMMPFGGSDPFGGMFQGMNSMMPNMSSMMSNMANMHRQMMEMPNNPGNASGHSYSSSTVMSYSNDGQGAPQVYQATKSTTQAPGGVREEKRSYKDNVSGTQKMSINRQLGDKSYNITREKNVRTNDESENKEFNNLDEEDLETFEREWRERTNPYNRGGPRQAAVGDHRRHHDNRRHRDRQRAIQN